MQCMMVWETETISCYVFTFHYAEIITFVISTVYIINVYCFKVLQHCDVMSMISTLQNELLALHHHDDNNVEGIEDKCYVLGFAQYCRWVLPLD